MIFINNNLKINTFGFTHGPFVGVEIIGFPKDIEIDLDEICEMLSRRRGGASGLVTERAESDIPQIESGIAGGRTTGCPIRVSFKNEDIKNAESGDDFIPRPGHGDFTYYFNTGEFVKGATSARKTVGIVFAGALCKQYLRDRGVFINAKKIAPSDAEILAAKSDGDSAGGAAECNIMGLWAGFGNPDKEKLESTIASCVFNIPGVRALEFGEGFNSAKMRGSEFNDPIGLGKGGTPCVLGNNCGGILGGLATGGLINFKVYFKPTPTIKKPQQSVNLKTGEIVTLISENRSDPCIAIRGAVVAESAACIAIMDRMLD